MNFKLRAPRLGQILLTAIIAVPALIPWRAIAQEPSTPLTPSKKLDELAMRHIGFLGGDNNELGITPEQTKRLKAHNLKAHNETRAFGQKLEDMKRANVSDKDRFAYDSKIRMPMFRRHHREQWDLLTPAQQQRQRQLTLQYFGPMILGNNEIAEQIGLPESSRRAIASLSSSYREFMRRQEKARMAQRKATTFNRAIKIRDFTPSERKRLDELKESIFTASGKRREALRQEYSDLWAKGIRYKPPIFHGNVNAWNVQSANQLMEERRAEFARLSARAQKLIPRSCLNKWKELTGKPFEFKPWGGAMQAATSYR